LRGANDRKRWQARPVASGLLRALVVVVPALAGAVGAVVAADLLPEPKSAIGVVMWWGGFLLGAVVPALLCSRLVRRVIPLTALLKLTLLFPEEAPSRFKVARMAGKMTSAKDSSARARNVGRDGKSSASADEVLGLITALSLHDRRTRGHSERVRVFVDMLADELGVPDEERDRLRWAALLHDIGKLTVPAAILNKPAKPSEEEWEVLHRHPVEGVRIASSLLPLLGPWAGAIEHHHERYDGTGYPFGLAGSEIPYGARILAVADAFEVMTAARPYKKPLSATAARAELVHSSGTHFDPAMVRAFLGISLGALWWTIGVAALVAQLPVLGVLLYRGILPRVGRETANVAAAAAVVAGVSAAGVVNLPHLDVSKEPPAASPQEREVPEPQVEGAPRPRERERTKVEEREPSRPHGESRRARPPVRSVEIATSTPPTASEPDATRLSFTQASATSGQYSDAILLEARLTDSGGSPLESKEVSFVLMATQSAGTFTATTDEDGVAQIAPTLVERPGLYELTARFEGSERHGFSEQTNRFVIEKEASAVEFAVEGRGSNRTLQARLSDLDTSSDGIEQRMIDFYADGELIGSATTDQNGVAILEPPQRYRGGKRTFEARFEGDNFYRATSAARET